jgi:uncharacterized protein (TIGR02145 family)
MKYVYSVILLFIFFASVYPQNPCPGTPTVVYAGKTYHTVQIGNQCWLVENLDVGNQINGILEQTDNNIIEKYCYNDDSTNCTTLGGLYEWAEALQYKNGATNSTSPNPVFTGNVQGICPPGWHLPVVGDFNILENAVHDDGNALKAIGQGAGLGAGTNTSGFSALLAGTRFSDGTFSLLNIYNFFAGSTEKDAASVYFLDLGTDSNFIYIGTNSKLYGRSVRCLKDPDVINDNNCPESQGFWKNHTAEWPNIMPMMLGTLNSYSQSKLLAIFKTPVRGDASIILAYQLIAAKLNVANNSKLPDLVQNAILKSDTAIGMNKIPAGVRPNTQLGHIMISLAEILEKYNSGLLTPGCKYVKDGYYNFLENQNDNDAGKYEFALLGNYPNPFNPTTQIKFSLPDDGFVTLKIFNVTGQLVKTLVNENMTPGNHTIEWNATNDLGNNLPTGIYFYRLQAGSLVKTSKMIYMK